MEQPLNPPPSASRPPALSVVAPRARVAECAARSRAPATHPARRSCNVPGRHGREDHGKTAPEPRAAQAVSERYQTTDREVPVTSRCWPGYSGGPDDGVIGIAGWQLGPPRARGSEGDRVPQPGRGPRRSHGASARALAPASRRHGRPRKKILGAAGKGLYFKSCHDITNMRAGVGEGADRRLPGEPRGGQHPPRSTSAAGGGEADRGRFPKFS
jgi:hypothetical protein